MKRYVLGFAYSEEYESVALIRMGPTAPFPDCWNGLGGKIEPSDDGPEMAMEREFREESGVQIDAVRWEPTISLTVVASAEGNVLAKVGCYRALLTVPEMASVSQAPHVKVFRVANLPREIVPNLSWLVPFHVFADTYYGEVYEIAQPFHRGVVDQEPQEPEGTPP